MNNRQKLVQQQYLNNEKAVLRQLKKSYTDSLVAINDTVKNLQLSIDGLQQEYDWMDDNDPQKAIVKSKIQSKIYQKQYQEQLQSQVGGILSEMQRSQFVTVSDYLDKCYEDGFIGSIFDLHGQGVPLTMPINQESMVKAVQLDSKISKGLYTKLGEDVDVLKKRITSEVTRAIATGSTYAQTAQRLAGQTKIGFNKAARIARTEGHRIQNSAADDAAHLARDRGADVVKQWDSTLDGHTRESHVAVDGQIRELDEEFSNGLMFPGDPRGPAEEVIQCRCAYLQRARWAVGGSFTKMNNFTGQLETFDSPQDYDEFKKAFFSDENKKYMNYVEQMQDKYGTKDFRKVLDSMDDREYKHYSNLLKNNPVYNKNAVTVEKSNVATLTKTLSNYDDSITWAYDALESNFEYYRGLPERFHDPFDTFEAEISKYESQLATAFDKFDFATNTDSNAIEQILKDGKFKGIVETGTSNGELDIDLRKRATEGLFSFFDIDDLDPSEFEKYGYLGTADRAKMYGDCRVVFKKENLWDRTTFTVGDSLESYVNGGYKIPSMVSNPKIVSFSTDPFSPDMPDINNTAIKSIQKAFDSIEENGYFKGVINNQDYVELQFHGAVTLDDVAYIEIPQSSGNLNEILKIAESKGVKIKVKRG